MSKGLSEETKYEFNVYARQLNKDLTNLMDLLKKQDKDNKPILYAGRHLKKVILPVEEYQKMCKRLESIGNSKPNESLEELENYLFNEWTQNHINFGCDYKLEAELDKQLDNLKTIKQALLKAQDLKMEKEIEKLWWYIDYILDKSLGLQRTELPKENENE